MEKRDVRNAMLIGCTVMMSACTWIIGERDADGYSTRCREPQPYQDDVLLPPLDIPATMEVPPPKPGSKIPGVEPGVVSSSDGCLERPPKIYVEETPAPAPDTDGDEDADDTEAAGS